MTLNDLERYKAPAARYFAYHVFIQKLLLNPLESKGNYSATSNNMKLVHWPLMDGLLHLVQYSEEGRTGRGPSPHEPILVVPNATAHPSTASVPITVLTFPCAFNVAIKG